MATIFYSLNDDSIYAQNAVWATARAATAGTGTRNTTIATCQATSSGDYYVERGFFNFNTAALGASATITAATFGIYGTAKNGAGSGYNIFSSTCSNPVVLADFDLVGTTKLSDTDILQAAYSTTGYNIWTLNAAGLAEINKTGITKLSLRETLKDLANSAPADTADISYASYQATGTSTDPYLSITYTTPASFFALL